MKLVDLVAQYLGRPATTPFKPEAVSLGGASAQLPVQPVVALPVEPGDLPCSPDGWPPEWYELFEERAGIMEFEANLPRAQAELAAEACVRKTFRQKMEPKTLR